MPIRLKSGQLPKYRLVHATNHSAGCVLMADNIAKRRDHLFVDIQNAGQLSLFEQSADNEIIDEQKLIERLALYLDTVIGEMPLTEFFAGFYVKHGVLCSTSDLSSVLKPMEGKKIVVRREPCTTKNSRPTTFWTESSANKLWIRSITTNG
jgi:hypothetical protein